MNGKQTWIADRIDRSREAPPSKAARTRRAMFLRMLARKTVSDLLAQIEDPQERAAIMGDVLDMVAEHLHPILGRVEAMTAFNSRASDIGGPLKLGRAIANARAEQLFTKAANDGGEE